MALGQWETKGYLDLATPQTNNRAEHQAVISISEQFHSVDLRLVVVMDS